MREGGPPVRLIPSVGLWCIIKLKKLTSTLAPKTQGILFRGGNRFCFSVIIILKIISQFVKLPKTSIMFSRNKYIPSLSELCPNFRKKQWKIRAKPMGNSGKSNGKIWAKE